MKVTRRQLKAFCNRKGLTQNQLAEVLGVKANTVWRWEHGQMNIGPLAQRLIALIMKEPEGVCHGHQ